MIWYFTSFCCMWFYIRLLVFLLSLIVRIASLILFKLHPFVFVYENSSETITRKPWANIFWLMVITKNKQNSKKLYQSNSDTLYLFLALFARFIVNEHWSLSVIKTFVSNKFCFHFFTHGEMSRCPLSIVPTIIVRMESKFLASKTDMKKFSVATFLPYSNTVPQDSLLSVLRCFDFQFQFHLYLNIWL